MTTIELIVFIMISYIIISLVVSISVNYHMKETDILTASLWGTLCPIILVYVLYASTVTLGTAGLKLLVSASRKVSRRWKMESRIRKAER